MPEDRIDSLLRQLQALIVEESSLISEIQTENRRRHAQQNPAPTAPVTVGSRVRITNNVNRPTNWTGVWNAHIARQSTFARVVSIRGGRIYVRTETGFLTWRIAANLRAIA